MSGSISGTRILFALIMVCIDWTRPRVRTLFIMLFVVAAGYLLCNQLFAIVQVSVICQCLISAIFPLVLILELVHIQRDDLSNFGLLVGFPRWISTCMYIFQLYSNWYVMAIFGLVYFIESRARARRELPGGLDTNESLIKQSKSE
jgi:hypothetical protein